ncbi:hypothetical protein BFR04_15865 [Gaetbulibacter sp. 4G1]|nr:T9SS type A sorting domain-containing protein [Gaetbulibacter sp. 4G1]PIA80685.1 hypothetical protein BFR04_15865 [Gaetbulibacter sp. 4G1]
MRQTDIDFRRKVACGEIIKLFPLKNCNENRMSAEERLIMIRNKEFQSNIKQLKKGKVVLGYTFVFFISLLMFLLFGGLKAHAQFNPKDVSDLMFFVESANLSTTHHVANCESDFCLNHPNSESAIITEQYCDVTDSCGDGCVRRWIDQSTYAGTFNPPEYTNGRNFGQDDKEKPCYVSNCINGKPCVRGGPAYGDDGMGNYKFEQDKYLEIEGTDAVSLTGEFSIFLLAKPIDQTATGDWSYFGLAAHYVTHRVSNNTIRMRVGNTVPPSPVVTITTPEAVQLGQWQLIEIHRDALGNITSYINGVDKSVGANSGTGTFKVGYLLSNFKTGVSNGQVSMHGDVAAFLIYNKKTSSIENNDIREYFDTNYLGNVLSAKNDKISNKIDVFPNPMIDEVTIKVNKTGENFYENETPVIYDIIGKKIKTEILKKETKNTIEYSIHLNTNLNKGIYFLSLRGNSIKLVKN